MPRKITYVIFRSILYLACTLITPVRVIFGECGRRSSGLLITLARCRARRVKNYSCCITWLVRPAKMHCSFARKLFLGKGSTSIKQIESVVTSFCTRWKRTLTRRQGGNASSVVHLTREAAFSLFSIQNVMGLRPIRHVRRAGENGIPVRNWLNGA